MAARETFGELGYEASTIRDIARRAGVDPALIHHYFGTKQTLFLSVMSVPFDVARLRGAVLAGDRERVGERLIATMLTLLDDHPEVRAFLTGIVRSATTDRQAASLLREFLGRQGLFEIVAAVATDRAELRTTLVGSQFVGLAMARYIIGIEPLASLPRDQVVAAIGPTISRYLVGDIDPPA